MAVLPLEATTMLLRFLAGGEAPGGLAFQARLRDLAKRLAAQEGNAEGEGLLGDQAGDGGRGCVAIVDLLMLGEFLLVDRDLGLEGLDLGLERIDSGHFGFWTKLALRPSAGW